VNVEDAVPVPVPDGYDLTNPDIYSAGVPLAEYAWLRRSAPVFWNAQTV
jgi:cholest-4-en-3-one 26-monooxygenase